jgi:two-component system, NarL family, response regulator DevR
MTRTSAVRAVRASGTPIRVFLLDDHELVRSGIRQLLEFFEDVEVVGEAATAAAAVPRILAAEVDVAVLDVNLPDGDGVTVCREVRGRRPDVRCLILTSYADEAVLRQARAAGACGYVLKQVRGGDLVTAIRRCAGGLPLADHPDGTAGPLCRGPATDEARLAALSLQERRILGHLAEGRTNREIGERMHLAEKTVKNYTSNLLAKLGMDRRAEAAAFAARLAERREPVTSRPDAHLDPILW